VLVQWEWSNHRLKLYMTDPTGELVANGTDDYDWITWINYTSTMPGVYSFAVEAWATEGASIEFLINTSHEMTRLYHPFGGRVHQDEFESRWITVNTTRRPLFIRVSWDNWEDDVNITLFGPEGNKIDKPEHYWGSETSVFLLIFLEEPGKYKLRVTGGYIQTGEGVSYTAATNFPISDKIGSETGEYTFLPWAVLTLILCVVLMSVIALIITQDRKSRHGVYHIEEVFVIHRDGRLIHTRSRIGEETPDSELMSAMLVAIQGFVKEGLRSAGVLESIKYGDNLVLLTAGHSIWVAALIEGEPGNALDEELDGLVQRIEISYGPTIQSWTGDASELEGLDEMVRPILELRSDG
jgi:hypothetical protein